MPEHFFLPAHEGGQSIIEELCSMLLIESLGQSIVHPQLLASYNGKAMLVNNITNALQSYRILNSMWFDYSECKPQMCHP